VASREGRECVKGPGYHLVKGYGTGTVIFRVRIYGWGMKGVGVFAQQGVYFVKGQKSRQFKKGEPRCERGKGEKKGGGGFRAIRMGGRHAENQRGGENGSAQAVRVGGNPRASVDRGILAEPENV